MKRYKNNLNIIRKSLSGLVSAIHVNISAVFSKIAGKKVIIFVLHAANQLPHILSVLERLTSLPLERKLECTILVVKSEVNKAKNECERRNLKAHISSYYAAPLLLVWDVVIAIDQRMRLPLWNLVKGRRLCMFHGQPTKGNVYSNFNYRQLDGLFFYGPLMREYYFAEKSKNPLWPNIPVWDVGQPKSDELFTGGISQSDALKSLDLDVSRKTVVYAPSFENCSSIAEHGEEIINALVEIEHNLIVKPHPAFYRAVKGNDAYSQGIEHAEEWRSRAAALRKNNNVVFEIDRQIDARLTLISADVLVTDHSGIAFDAILLDKPVIYFDCPRFFDEYLPTNFGIDGESARNCVACNAGRDAGMVVSDTSELICAIDQYLSNTKLHSAERKRIRDILLFNQGHATDVFVRTLMEIME